MTAALTALGVRRVPVPVPFPEAGGPANVYVIDEDGGGLALFDAGIGTPEGERALLAGFAAMGRSLSEVRRIFISHGHLDHYGYARAAQEASGAPVFAHVRDHDKLLWRDRDPARLRFHDSYLQKLGAVAHIGELNARFQEHLERMARPLEHVEPLQNGALLKFAKFQAEVLHLPGHTPGLVCLFALGAPGRLQAGVRKRGFQGLFRHFQFVGHGGIEPGGGHVGTRHTERTGAEHEVAAGLVQFGFSVGH